METKAHPKWTRLLFCTTGILLRRLEGDPDLDLVTHVVVDEVHERSEESDFLLMILRDVVRRRKDLRVLLMSATLNADLFSRYFGGPSGQGVPIIEIPGRTFPVDQIYLEDAIEMAGYAIEDGSPVSFYIMQQPVFRDFSMNAFDLFSMPRESTRKPMARASRETCSRAWAATASYCRMSWWKTGN